MMIRYYDMFSMISQMWSNHEFNFPLIVLVNCGWIFEFVANNFLGVYLKFNYHPISFIRLTKGRTSFFSWGNALYYTSVVPREIYVCSRIDHKIEHITYIIMQPFLYRTEPGYVPSDWFYLSESRNKHRIISYFLYWSS